MNAKNGTIRDPVSGSQHNHQTQLRDSSLIEELDTEQPVELREQRPLFWNKAITALKRLVVPIAFGAAVLAILAFGGLFSKQEATALPATSALDVEVITVDAESSYQVHRSYLGTIESRRNSSLSFEVGGKLDLVAVDEGETVEKGAVLAELDTKLLRSNREVVVSRIETAQARLEELVAGPREEDIESARAQVRRWQSQLKLARITSKRLVRLNRSNAVSRQEADDAIYNEQVVEAQLDLATSQLAELENGTRKEQIAAQQSTVKQLQAELATVDINIEKSQLLAPYSGIISARLLDEGEVIASGQPVFELLDNGQLEARVGLPVNSIESVTRTTKYQLVYHEQKINAKLKSVRPEKNADTRTVDVVFEIETMTNPASIGDMVRLELSETVSENGFWIPASAMVETFRGLWGCYVAERVDGDSSKAVLRLRELEVLHREEEMAFVKGSLQQGEQVIASGVHRLVPDQNVHIANRTAIAASRF